MLERLGASVMAENDAARRRVDSDTVFYMPHCGVALYNNAVASNWASPHRVVLVGNRCAALGVRCAQLSHEGAVCRGRAASTPRSCRRCHPSAVRCTPFPLSSGACESCGASCCLPAFCHPLVWSCVGADSGDGADAAGDVAVLEHPLPTPDDDFFVAFNNTR